MRGIAGALAAGAAVLAFGGGLASAHPYSILVPHRFAQPPTTSDCEGQIGIACYNPAQYEQAYGTSRLYAHGITGRGTTIVIVDAFGSPTIQNDLAVFDQDNNLPNPPAFKIITPAGRPPPYDPSNGDMGSWAIETSLDVEYAHAIAPGANILLVETPVSETEGVQGFPQIVAAERYVIDHHLGDVITQSFGATEETFQDSHGHLDPALIYGLRSAYEDAAAQGVTVLGASGDGGASDNEPNGADFYPFRVDSWPSSDPLVTSVGGTQLFLDANGNRTQPDQVWNDTALLGSPASGGGGVSAVFSRPFYQNPVRGVVGGSRGTPDISMTAAVDGGANVYMSFTSNPQQITAPGYYPVGGTSEASPVFSGIVSLADQIAGHSIGLINPSLYQIGDRPGSGITDTTTGNNTVSFTNSDGSTYTVQGYDAGPGYDLASGLGTANGALPLELAALGRGSDRRP